MAMCLSCRGCCILSGVESFKGASLVYLQDLGSLAADLAERVGQALHQGAEEEGQVGHNVQVWHARKHLHQRFVSLASCAGTMPRTTTGVSVQHEHLKGYIMSSVCGMQVSSPSLTALLPFRRWTRLTPIQSSRNIRFLGDVTWSAVRNCPTKPSMLKCS